MIKRISSLLIVMLCIGAVFAQKKSTEYAWEATKPTTSIPDSLLESDAVCIYKLQEIRYRRGGLSYFVNKIRIKILTKRGLDNYASYSVFRPDYTTLNTLDARTIKSNGKIVDFNTSDIKRIELKKNKKSSLRIQRLSVPGVEVGDEIEFIYVFQYDGIMEDQDIFLHTEIPTMVSTFKQVLDNMYDIDFRTYNNMPNPYYEKKETESTYQWILNNIEGTNDNEYGILQESLPFIRYSVIYNMNANTKDFLKNVNKNWSVMYTYYSAIIKNDVFENTYWGKSLEGYINKHNEKNPNLSVDQKIYYLSSILNDSLKITDFDPKSPSRPAMYYLINKTMDTRMVLKFIDSYLKLNNIRYFVAFSRNRYEGNIDINFARPKTVSEIFYVIMNENKDLHYLYPPSHTTKYYIDELPNSIAGTQAILITDLGGFKSDRLNITTMNIPYNETNTNIWSKKTNLKISLKEDNIKNEFITQYTLIGDVSTNLRNNIINLGNSRDSIVQLKDLLELNSAHNIDTIFTESLEKIYPYNYSYKFKGEINDIVQKIDNNNYSILIDKLINHYTLNTTEQKRILNFYCPFAYSDVNKIYITFDSDIDLINSDFNKFSITTSPIANYTIEVRKLNKNVIMIESKLDLLKIKLSPAEYVDLHKANDALLKTSQSRILIKTI